MTRSQPFWTQENIKRASILWAEGKTYTEIAQIFGDYVTKNMVTGMAGRNREMFPQRSNEADVETLNTIADMWMKGYGAQRIADELGVSKGSVAGRIKRNKHMFPDRELVADVNPKVAKPRVKKAVTVSDNGRIHAQFNGTKRATYFDPALDEFEISQLPGYSLIENNGCMYPLTDNSPHMFCGHTRFKGKRYCEHHTQKTKGYSGIDFGYRERYDRNIVRTPVEATS